ncbi:MAG TPA: TetR/AcrR family transcriptional regulator [Alphaproteobacteria bacterium]|nr:TetR/AcrR family transcriptional regulator [Alphaproteobacteria bacterium]
MAPDPGIDRRRETILAAAYVQFMRYGYRRTAMEDIARETGVSRASLYRHFANKEEIFRSLAERLHDEAVAAAEQALKAPGPVAERVREALEAKSVRFLEVMHGSPHGAELVDESSRLCGELAAASEARVQKLLTEALRAAARAGEVDLARAGVSAVAAAELLVLAAAGLKHGAGDVDAFRTRLAALVRVFFAGTGAGPTE